MQLWALSCVFFLLHRRGYSLMTLIITSWWTQFGSDTIFSVKVILTGEGYYFCAFGFKKTRFRFFIFIILSVRSEIPKVSSKRMSNFVTNEWIFVSSSSHTIYKWSERSEREADISRCERRRWCSWMNESVMRL